MAKKTVDPILKQYEMKDPKIERTLLMFVTADESERFENCESFVKKVEIACKITDANTGKVYKNKCGPKAA